MKLQQLIAQLPQTSWLLEPHKLTQFRGKVSVTSADSSNLLNAAKKALETKDWEMLANTLYLGLLFDEERFLSRLQKDGLLRMSRFSYDQVPLTQVIGSLREHDLGLSAGVSEYLTSIANLYQVARRIRQVYEQLKEWLCVEREAGLKAALAWLDFLFLKKTFGIHDTNDHHVTSQNLYFFSIEEMAEGFSSILALYGNEFGPPKINPILPEQLLEEGIPLQILNLGAHLAKYREWEFQIDRQQFHLVETDRPNEFALKPPSYEYLRAVELGFIRTRQQSSIVAMDVLESGGHSFRDFAHNLVLRMEQTDQIRLHKAPLKRFTFEFPEEMFKATAKIVLSKEENAVLETACHDLMVQVDKLMEFDLHDGLTFRNVFQVTRMIEFIRSIMAAKLLPETEANLELVIQSLIPVFSRKALARCLSTVIPQEKVDKALEVWTVDIGNHVDIQYRPIIPVGDSYWIATNVFASSNYYRNPLQTIQKRLYPDGSDDPLSALICNNIKQKGYHAQAGVKYNQGDIDVLALIDGTLFAFECKNSLLPTGIHEMMTSLDYINYAAEQLGRFQRRMSDSAFRQDISNKVGFTIGENIPLVTGIVVSNRMFMGLRINGHPVRGAYELEHFINEGAVSIGNEKHCFWRGDTFTGEDLRRFLEEDITYLAQWQCMKPYSAIHEINDCKVLVDRLYMDALALAQSHGFENAIQGLIDQQLSYQEHVRSFSLGEHHQRVRREVQLKTGRKERKKRKRELELKREHRRKQ